MLGYLQLLRPLNGIMTAVSVLIGGMLIIRIEPAGFLWGPVLLAMLIAFLITGAGNAINDYFDVDVDRINRPRRPIPSGRVSKRGALAFSLGLFIIGVLLAGFINWITFIIALFNSLLLIAYSYYLQNKLIMGNIAVSYMVGSGFLFGGACLGNLELPLLLLLLAMLANTAREIVKDLEDLEGDRAGFIRRLSLKAKKQALELAGRFGVRAGSTELRYSKQLKFGAAVSLALAIAISPAPYMLGILGLSYVFVVAVTDIIFLACIFGVARSRGKRGYGRISMGIKLGMLFGLIAFLAGVFI